MPKDMQIKLIATARDDAMKCQKPVYNIPAFLSRTHDIYVIYQP
jgi:hypothetical protein